jgi:hypothetical protein
MDGNSRRLATPDALVALQRSVFREDSDIAQIMLMMSTLGTPTEQVRVLLSHGSHRQAHSPCRIPLISIVSSADLAWCHSLPLLPSSIPKVCETSLAPRAPNQGVPDPDGFDGCKP